jgi:hypothetical protein
MKNVRIINKLSTDPSKIFDVEGVGLVRLCTEGVIRKLLNFRNRVRFSGAGPGCVLIDPIPFHNGPSTWSSAQVKFMINFVTDLAADLARAGMAIRDGHPWNYMFDGVNPFFLDLGSFFEGTDSSVALSELHEICDPLAIFYRCSYARALRIKIAEELHGESRFSRVDVIRNGFRAMGDNDSYISFEERLARITTPDHSSTGTWVQYRDSSDIETAISSDPRINILESILIEKDIKTVIDIGSNDGLHSIYCAKRHPIKVLSIEIEDALASRLFHYAKINNLEITSLCSTLEDYIFHLNFVDRKFWPKIELAILFAIYHHLAHDSGYNFTKLVDELRSIGVKYCLLELVDYDDIFLRNRTRRDDYGLEKMLADANELKIDYKLYEFHELGRRLIFFSI